MNAVLPEEVEMVAITSRSTQADSAAVEHAQIYHFLELALAHPGEEGYEYFCKKETEFAFLRLINQLIPIDHKLSSKGRMAAGEFFSILRKMSYEEVEAAHIGLFTNNYPHLPCPPYGSLFTAIDSEKRLEEMLAIKEFYQRNGIDIADSFDDLPDHLCVELEFMQVLCFRENDADTAGELDVVTGVRNAQVEFLDRFLMPFASRLAEIAIQSEPSNPYSHLLEVMSAFIAHHRRELASITETSPSDQET